MSSVIAIDGPAGAGKSTAARALAARLGFRHVDTGATYRAVAVLAAERHVPLDDDAALGRLVDDLVFDRIGDRVVVGGRDLTEVIRRRESGELASRVSARPAVRQRLVALQRTLAGAPGVVMEGRDIGTVVFPDAPVKFYLTASPAERARRRAAELRTGGAAVDETALAAEIARRDERDASRPVAPLRAAPDALTLDTTSLALEEVVAFMERVVRIRLGVSEG